MNVFGDPLETIWRNCVFGLCGTADFYRRTFSVVVTSTVIQRKEWLDEVRKSIDTYFPGKNESKSSLAARPVMIERLDFAVKGIHAEE
jgi:hypothetical protein